MVDLRKGYQDGDSKYILQQKDDFYLTHYPLNAPYWQQGLIDKRFVAGDQTLWSLIFGNAGNTKTQRYFFNLIRRHRNMIGGYQRRNRKSTVAIGQKGTADDPLADDLNQVLRWCEDYDGTQEYFSQSFENALDVGVNWLHMYPDYLTDPVSSNLCLDSVSYNSVLVDSYFRKRDLSDCNGIIRRRWVSQKAAMALLPGRDSEIKKMSPRGIKDGKFALQAELINLNLSKLYTYDEYYYRDFREATIILDPKTGESYEWEEDETADEDEFDQVMAQQPWLVISKVQKPTVKLAISLNDRLMYDGPNLLGLDRYPFIPSLCYYEPDLPSYQWRLQGIVRNMRDAQYLYNRVKIIQLQILESQINSGWIYKTDRLVDPKALRQSGEGFLVPIKPGDAPINDSVQRIESAGVPQSIIELSEMLAQDLPRITGVNEELLGSAEDDAAGILSMLRQSAGVTTLNGILDGADYAQRLLGRLRFEAIQKLFTKSKVRNILGREPHPKFFSPKALKYDIVVEEGFYSTTQRQMELKQLLYFKQLGMPIADKSILNVAIINNKKQVIEDMQETAQQQQQAQQQQSQIEQQKAQADLMMKYAQSKSELARSKDLMASASEKIAKISDHQTQAQYNLAKADLEIVKQLVELENLDLQGLKQSIEIAEALKQRSLNEVPKTQEVV